MSPTRTIEQVRELEFRAQLEYFIPPLLLMENAARSIADCIVELQKPPISNNQIVIFCGSGNNGGDGYAAARHLYQKDLNVTVIQTPSSNFTEEAALNYRIMKTLQIPIIDCALFDPNQMGWDSKYLLLVDALMGTGFKPPLREKMKRLISQLNELRMNNKGGARVISVDIPSGINGNTGPASETVVKADTTVTFTCLKPGLLNPKSQAYTGKIRVVDIGIPKQLLL